MIARRRRATRLLQRLVLAVAFLLLAPRAHAQSPGGAFADSSEFFDDSSLGR